MSAYRLTWEWAGASGEVLDPDGVVWSEQSALFGGASGRQVTVTARLHLPVCTLIRTHGHRPESGRATLYAGDEVLLSGPWRDVEWGTDEEPVTITLAETDEEDVGTLGGSSMLGRQVYDQSSLDAYLRQFRGHYIGTLKIIEALWVNAQHTAVGRWYPWVIGAPGTADHPGSPAYLIDVGGTYDAGLLAHGGDPGGVTDATVWGPTVADTTSWDSEAATVTVTEDLDGNTVTRCDFGSMGSQVQRNDDGTYYVSWTSGGPTPGGAGDVCILLLAASSVRWDVGAWQAVRSRLNAYTLAGYVEEPVSPVGLLRSSIWPLLPLTVVTGPHGLAPVLWPWLDDERGGIPVRAGAGMTRAGRVRRLALEPEPEVTVEYGWDPHEGVYTGSVRVTAQDSVHSAHAVTAGGRVESSPIQARMVWDERTAALIAHDRVRMAASPPDVVPYMADPARHGAEGTTPLRVGDPVRLTDDDLLLVDAPGVVGEIERDGTGLRISIYLRG